MRISLTVCKTSHVTAGHVRKHTATNVINPVGVIGLIYSLNASHVRGYNRDESRKTEHM